MIRSPSQCPGTALSSASGGRRLMVAPRIQLLPLGSGFSGQRGAGDAAGASGAQGLFHPQLGAQAAGALNVQGLVDLLVTDAHALIIGVLEPQAGGDLPGTDPILQQVDDPLAQGRVGVQLADLGAGQPRPGRGLRRRGAVDPVRARPTADLAGHGLPAPADPAGDEGGRIPLRQARGDHGPLTGPQAQAPTDAPRHPRVGSPVIRWPHGAPAPPSAQNLTAMRGLDGGNGADGGTHTRIVQPPARGPDRHAPGPGGPGPPGPGRPGLEHRPPAPGGRQGASTHGPHRQSHTRLPSPPPHRRVRHAQLPSRRGRRPTLRNQLHRPQAHLISDPHPTRHINHSSEPVMVQPSPDTKGSSRCSRVRSARLGVEGPLRVVRRGVPGSGGGQPAVSRW